MLDLGDFPSSARNNIAVFTGDSPTAGQVWHTWQKPRGVSMLYLFALAGGNSGAASTAGAAGVNNGGGGGGSSGQVSLLVPAFLLPDILFVSVGVGAVVSADVGIDTYIAVARSTVANDLVLRGRPAFQTGIADCPLAGLGRYNFIASSSGSAAGANLSLPTAGQRVTGGAGGANNPAANNTAGSAGGNITGAGVIVGITGGGGGTTAPTAGKPGAPGRQAFPKLGYWLGGSGGGSTGISATPTGSTGGRGGDGSYGCGGGGGGGSFTGQAVAPGGAGGPGLVIIIGW